MVRIYRISVEDFLFPDASLERPSEPGAEHGARLADDDLYKKLTAAS
jgi:hypothetical protein